MGAEALRSLSVTPAGAREESEEMLSDALAAIGVSLEGVRREAGETFDTSIPSGRKIPYSPMTKNALVRARREMKMLGDDHPDTEHVLVGILAHRDGTAVRLLARLGVAPEALEDRLNELRGRTAD